MQPRRLIALVTAASGIGNGFGRFTFPALLPAMRNDLLGSYSAAGFLGTANVGAYLLGALVVMLVSLRRPPEQILIAGLGCSTVAMFTLALAQNLAGLAVGMVLAGVGGASIFIPAPGIVGPVVPVNRRGFTVGVVNAGIGVATLVGTQLARFSGGWWGTHGWRWVWAIMGCGAVCVFVVAATQLRATETRRVATPRLTALREAPRWAPYTFGYFAFGFGYILFITYLVSYLREEGFSAAHAANVYAGLAVGIAFGIAVGRFSDRFGRRYGLVAGYGGCALCPLLALSHREPFVAIAAFAFGMLFSGAVAVVATYLSDVVPAADFGPAFAVVTMAFSLAQAAGPQVGGALRDATGGFGATFALSAAVLAVAAVVSLWLPASGHRNTATSLAAGAQRGPTT